jgi:hypothetical protein
VSTHLQLINIIVCTYRVYFNVCTEHLVQSVIQIINHADCRLCVLLFLQLIVEHCEIPIKSVELQLVRVETCGCAEGYARDGKQKNFVVFISTH